MKHEMPTSEAELMIVSIHPRHVANILSGKKTVELRRTRPNVASGQPLAIYATNPDSALVAVGTVESVEVGAPKLLRQVALLQAAGVSGQEYDAYFAGSHQAVALHLRDITPLQNQVALSHLRSRRRYTPPQTWHFFDAEGLRSLLGDHAAHDELLALI